MSQFEFLAQRARQLEDEFFAKQDAVLVAKRGELERMAHTQAALSEVSGITNEAVLAHLVKLDLHADLLATLALVPLVEVAWADGAIQAPERRAVLDVAAGSGMAPGSVDYALLEAWLAHRPASAMLEAWVLYIQGLSEALTKDEREAMRTQLMSRARLVADAAGGFLGLTPKTSRDEKGVLARMNAAFDVR